MTNILPGLDMAAALDFYAQNQEQLFGRLSGMIEKMKHRGIELDSMRELQINTTGHQILWNWKVRDCLCLFPPKVWRRIQSAAYFCGSMHWFDRDSTKDHIVETANRDRALSPTCIIPSQVFHSCYQGVFSNVIKIYQLDHGHTWTWGDNIADIVTTQAIIHETAHALWMSAWAERHGPLWFDRTRKIGAEAAIFEFGELVQGLGCGPISAYSSVYWKDGGTRLVLNREEHGDAGRYQHANYEEFAETVAAYILGFSFRGPDHPLNLDPFADRKIVKDWIELFLNAQAEPRER